MEHCAIGNFVDNSVCPTRSCHDVEETESVQQILCECLALQNRRYQFLGDRTFEDLGMVANVPLREQAGVRGSSVSLLTDNDKRAYSHWVTQCVIWSLSEILRERQANR